MAVETADDLAGMFDQGDFAEAAQYLSPGGGSPVPCSVIVTRGQARGTFKARGDDAAAATSERMLLAQQSELARVERGGMFTMLDSDGVPTGERFKVQGMPQLDETAMLWSVELLIVD